MEPFPLPAVTRAPGLDIVTMHCAPQKQVEDGVALGPDPALGRV